MFHSRVLNEIAPHNTQERFAAGASTPEIMQADGSIIGPNKWTPISGDVPTRTRLVRFQENLRLVDEGGLRMQRAPCVSHRGQIRPEFGEHRAS